MVFLKRCLEVSYFLKSKEQEYHRKLSCESLGIFTFPSFLKQCASFFLRNNILNWISSHIKKTLISSKLSLVVPYCSCLPAAGLASLLPTFHLFTIKYTIFSPYTFKYFTVKFMFVNKVFVIKKTYKGF